LRTKEFSMKSTNIFIHEAPGSGVLAACSRHIIRAQHFSRVVSENYCVIGQFEVGVVNALSAGAEVCTGLDSFEDFPGVLHFSFS